ncbi:MAG TPA: GNAT family N-acetyltransferase [Gammaproteobacteria bacterium]|nr:GNAT family N-acetyltransferase [Gammaproteobacteria bacterium]
MVSICYPVTMTATREFPKFRFEDITRDDFPALVTLNDSCVPYVNSIGLIDLENFSDQARCFFKVCDQDANLAGFVIALRPGESYQSVNYRWFVDKYDSFLYIDRIMVHLSFRRKGIATLIYERLESIARDSLVPRLCCEVNLVPPNPESLRLHREIGFESVGTQATERGSKEVVLLVKPLNLTE